MRPQTPFIWSIETPLSIMEVSTFGNGSLHSTVLNIKGHSLRNCEGQWWWLPVVPTASGYCDSEQSGMPVDFGFGVCMCFFLLDVGRVRCFGVVWRGLGFGFVWVFFQFWLA